MNLVNGLERGHSYKYVRDDAVTHALAAAWVEATSSDTSCMSDKAFYHKALVALKLLELNR